MDPYRGQLILSWRSHLAAVAPAPQAVDLCLLEKDILVTKLKIDDGSPREPGIVYLRLVETDPGHIAVEAVYDYTTDLPPEEAVYLPGGGLLVITADGYVALSPNIDPALGFPLDHDGRLQLDSYCEAQTAKRGRYQGKRAVLVTNGDRASG